MGRRIKKGCGIILLSMVALAIGATAFAFYQAQRPPAGRPEYVALGSSFAAGAGLGPLQDDSPWLCARSIDGYPQQLARKFHLSIVDMSCGGALTRHLLTGGRFFLGPQVAPIGKQTRLVTLTIGGNDVGYIGDLSMLASRNSDSVFGWFLKHLWGGPRSKEGRHYAQLRTELEAALIAIHQRAPKARIVVATYPVILPPAGGCPRISLSHGDAAMMREVGNQLALVTRSAAIRGGATLVNMQRLGVGHDACSASPWTRGWTNGGIAPFHPTLQGARATAEAIADAIGRSP